jgi:hypothetical protein
MRFGRRFLFIIGIVLLSSLHVAADEAPAWTAWLHYGRHMTLIDSHGNTLREVDLPIPQGYRFSNEHLLGISHDGNRIAYLLQTNTRKATELLVYDLMNETTIASYPVRLISEHEHIIINRGAFNETNTGFVFGYTQLDWGGYTVRWDVIAIDLRTGQVSSQLDSEHAAFSTIDFENDRWQVAVQTYQDNEITFTLEVSNIEDHPQSFVWNLMSNSLREDVIYSGLSSDSFDPTGEIVAAYSDIRFPFVNEESPLNTVQVYDPTIKGRFPFHMMSGYPQFIQNGERILITAFNCDFLLCDDYRTIIERDGELIAEWSFPDNINNLSAKGTPDGFIYTAQLRVLGQSQSQSSLLILPAVYEVDTRDNTLDTGRLVWQIPIKEFHAYFESSEQPYFDIAWVHSDAPVGPFKPWAQLAEPVYAPTPQPSDTVITPTPLPTPPPLFYVGQTVTVQTLDGEILNLRADPTRESDILIYVEDDTRIELLEGPVIAEGFHWWRVRLPDGLEGWVVENDGDLQTLVPD